jgi:hypothetical protein
MHGPLELARIAVEEHLADSAQVAEAQAHARRSGEPLVVALVSIARVSDAALARTLARRLGLALETSLEPDSDALRELGHDVALRHRVLPLAIELPADDGPRLLRVAMADPTDHQALALIEASTGCRIEPVLASLGALEDAIARGYRGFVTEVIPRAETEPAAGAPPPPARSAPRVTERVPFGASIPEVSTQPFHRLDDEAPLELRLRALVQLLAEKGLLGEDEWLERIRQLLQQRE